MPGEYRRGDVVEIDLSPIDLGITVGRELRKTRPCVILQNDIGNANSSTTIVAAISSAEAGHKLFPVIVFVPKGEAGLLIDSLVLCNQIRTVSKDRVGKTYGRLSASIMQKVDHALKISLAL